MMSQQGLAGGAETAPASDPKEAGAARVIHATAVSIAGRALLILGKSGAGKSALALRLMAYNAALISDDQVRLVPEDGQLWAECPSDAIRGLIEARGIGILRTEPADRAPVALVIDLDQEELQRLPLRQTISLCDIPLPLVLRVQKDHLAEALLAYMRGGRQE